jgi:hypothetical protein
MNTFPISSVAVISISVRNIPSYLLCRENSDELYKKCTGKAKSTVS